MHTSAIMLICGDRACKFFVVVFHLQFSFLIMDYNICHFITPSNNYLCELHHSNRDLLCAA